MIEYTSKSNNVHYIGSQMPTVLNISEVIYCLPFTIKSGYIDKEEHHDFWEFTYVKSGEVNEYSDTTQTRISAGEVYFHKPNEPHRTNSLGNVDSEVFFISFKADSKIMYLFNNLHISLNAELELLLELVIDIAKNTYIDNTTVNKHKCYVNMKPATGIPTGNQQLYKNYLEIFIIKVIQYIEATYGNVTYDSKDEFDKMMYNKIIKIISESIYSDFSIDSLSAKLNYSKTYLFTIFKKFSEYSIIQQYNIYKIEEAKRLLTNTDIPIYTISNRLKYCSPYYFSNTFKNHTGISPAQYRKSKNSIKS